MQDSKLHSHCVERVHCTLKTQFYNAIFETHNFVSVFSTHLYIELVAPYINYLN